MKYTDTAPSSEVTSVAIRKLDQDILITVKFADRTFIREVRKGGEGWPEEFWPYLGQIKSLLSEKDKRLI